MAERAQVTSLDAIESFRAKLIVFMTRARAALEEVGDEIIRTRSWLENDRRAHWDRECRRCHRALDEAQQELFNAKISRIHTQSAAQLMAVERAKHALRQAEEKRDLVKRWTREFGNRAEPLGKQVDQLLTLVTTDLPKASAHLSNILRTLEAYAAVAPGAAASASPELRPSATETDPTEPPAPATLPTISRDRSEATES